jgi:hypothetical protein
VRLTAGRPKSARQSGGVLIMFRHNTVPMTAVPEQVFAGHRSTNSLLQGKEWNGTVAKHLG